MISSAGASVLAPGPGVRVGVLLESWSLEHSIRFQKQNQEMQRLLKISRWRDLAFSRIAVQYILNLISNGIFLIKIVTFCPDFKIKTSVVPKKHRCGA